MDSHRWAVWYSPGAALSALVCSFLALFELTFWGSGVSCVASVGVVLQWCGVWKMSSTAAAVGAAALAGIYHLHPPFTASQWQELEHQALIYKYMVAGIPVPPDLLLSIRRSIASSGFLHHPGLSYSSFYGKKIDPEPGRCRRTDGKKWRCSKDAYPDSKYCERHMHRGRNRSRKPVEMPNTSLSSSSGGGAAAGMGALPSNFSNLPLNSSISISQGGHASALRIDHASPYGFVNKNYRYLHGIRDGDQHGFFAEGSLNAGGLGLDSAGDGSWSLMSSDMPLFPSAKDRSSSIWENNYQQIQGLQNLDAVTVCAAPSKQQQHFFFGTKFGSPKPIKQGGQSLRPFFDEWPKNRDSWTDSQDEGSNGASLATTQLSISMPVITSNFAASSSASPDDN